MSRPGRAYPPPVAAVDAEEWLARYPVALPVVAGLPRRVLVGAVNVIDCMRPDLLIPGRVLVSVCDSSAKADPRRPWCWVLANPRAFANLLSCRGMPVLFEVPDAVMPAEA